MDIGYVDHALDYLYSKYQRRNMNQYLFRSKKDIIQEPFLRNFYAGIKPSALQYLYPNRDENIIKQDVRYKKSICKNKRLCPWNERKLPKHRYSKPTKKKNHSLNQSPLFIYENRQFPIKKFKLERNYQEDLSDSDEYNYYSDTSSDETNNSGINCSSKLGSQQLLLARYFFKWLSTFNQTTNQVPKSKKVLKNKMTMTVEKGIQEINRKRLQKERKIKNTRNHVDEIDQIIDDVIFDDSYKRRYVQHIIKNG